MSECKESRIDIYIDDELVKENAERFERKEIFSKISGYGDENTTPYPGYKYNTYIGSLENGEHRVNVNVVDIKNNEVIYTIKKFFVKLDYLSRMYIDNPKKNETCDNIMQIRGWSMSECKDVKINILIDDTIIEEDIGRTERQDVHEKIIGYGDKNTTPYPGFEAIINAQDFVDGKHILKIQTVDRKAGRIIGEVTKEFILEKYKTKGCIDSFKWNQEINDDLEISGWVMSECENARIDIYFDDILVKENAERLEREDVHSAISGFGNRETTPLPGYSFNLYIGNYKDGIHTIKINVINEKENCIINSFTKDINKVPYKTKISIDTPARNSTNKGIIDVTGWVMTQDPYTEIKVLVDGVVVAENLERLKREDVIEKITGYGDENINPMPGYRTTIDINYLNDGKHELTINVIDTRNNRLVGETSKIIYLKKFATLINIEFPKDYGIINGDVEFSGWMMTEAKNHNLKLLLDGKVVSENIKRLEREDVHQTITDYGDTDINPLPGFEYIFKAEDLKEGDHIITLELYSEVGEKIETVTTHFYSSKHDLFGIDVSIYQGDIDWSLVKSSGVKFAIIRAGYRGWGTGVIVEDSKFEQNIKGALANGIKVGVYFYTQAINEAEAVEEFNFVHSLLKKYGVANQISYPIAIDSEFVNVRARDNNLSVEERTAVCKAFCEAAKKAGYKPAIYANKYWLNSKLNMDTLVQYDTWLAHYTENQKPSDYDRPYSIWQYTSEGIISGIDGDVDLNISYKNY